MIIRENYELLIENHPYFESLNKKLLEEMAGMEWPESYRTNVNAKMTSWNTKSPTIKVIWTWIQTLIRRKYPWLPPSEKLYLYSSWFASYGVGESTRVHEHLPNVWSFAYFVNCPRGSSPLIFRDGNKKIHPKAGDLVIFPAHLTHKIPPNKCMGRTSIVGNFYWKTKYIAFEEADNSTSIYNLE